MTTALLCLLSPFIVWGVILATNKPRVYVKVHPKPQPRHRSRVRYRMPRHVGSDQVQPANQAAAA